MPQYIRALIPGGTFFFTVALLDRRQNLLVARIDRLRKAFRHIRERRPFRMDAAVILPDHLHCIWTLPDGDADFSTRWRLIKSRFSQALATTEPRCERRIRLGERGIWQRRYWEHVIRDERDYAQHLDYIHFNPVKHGYVARAADWPHSSFLRHMRQGAYPEDWAVQTAVRELEFE